MLRRIKRKPIAEINVVPYIDVMLVLLVIFMVTAPLLYQGVKVDLPKAQASAMDQHKGPLIISVSSKGQYFLNTAKHPKHELSARALVVMVQQAVKNDQNRPVLVKGDRKANYEQVIDAMVLLQKAGVEKVGLVTEQVFSHSTIDN